MNEPTLQQLESRIQSLEEMLLNHIKQTINIVTILEHRDQASRQPSTGRSRTSSAGSHSSSTDQSAAIDDEAEDLTEYQRTNAFDEIMGNLRELDHFFDRFIARGGGRSFVQRSDERIQDASTAFVEAATSQLENFLGKTKAQAIITHLNNLSHEEIIDVLIGLSHRHRARVDHGIRLVHGYENYQFD